MAIIEERLLYFGDFDVRLRYLEDGRIAMLRLEHKNGTKIVINSQTMPIAPEKIYELLRECEVSWKD